MRFPITHSFGEFSIADVAARWVHPSVQAESASFRQHALFIGWSAGTGLLTAIAIPAILAALGKLATPQALMICLAALPFVWACVVAQTGKLRWGILGLSATLALFVACLSLITGGLASPFLVFLLLLPLENAMFDGKRGAVSGVLMATAAVLFVGFVSLAQSSTLPDASLWYTAIITLALYCSALAYRIGANKTAALDRLQAEHSRFRILAENATDLVTKHDAKGNTLFASPATRPLLGVSADQLIGSGLFERIHLQDRILFLNGISASHHKRQQETQQVRMRSKTGENQLWKWVEMRFNPDHKDGSGRPTTGVTVVSRDISELKQQQLALEEANNVAVESGEAQRRFLMTMSHELRTPLNAIIGFSDILKQELFGSLPHERHSEYVELIQDSGQHLLQVVNDLLDLSRIEAGRYQLSVQSFNILEIADATVKMLQPMARQGKVTVACDILPTLPEIVADKRACQQILINLISNAIKFTPEGGHVRITARQHGRSIKLRVKDTGIGIDEAFMENLGQPFRQADSGYDRQYEGSGLGLSVVKGIVDLHGGDLEIRSTRNVGTSVTVTLPIKTKVARPVPADEQSQLVQLNSNRPTNPTTIDVKSERKGASRARLSA